MIPIGRLKGDLELQVLLESFQKSVVTVGATPWNITSIELVCEIVELSDTSQQIVNSVSPPDQPIYIHSNEWRYFSNQLPANTTGLFSSLISARYNSLKTLVCLPIHSTQYSSQAAWSLSSRVNPNIDSYQWRLGSVLIPNKQIILNNAGNTGTTTAGFSEGFAESLKSFHGFNNMYSNQIIGYFEYNVWDQATSATLNITQINGNATSYANAFGIAQDLEVFTNRNDTLLQGVNSLFQNIYHDLNISTAPNSTALGAGTNTGYILNYFANFDVILIIENGVMRATW